MLQEFLACLDPIAAEGFLFEAEDMESLGTCGGISNQNCCAWKTLHNELQQLLYPEVPDPDQRGQQSCSLAL